MTHHRAFLNAAWHQSGPNPLSHNQRNASNAPGWPQGGSPHESRTNPEVQITQRIHDLTGWRGETLAHIRRLIHQADPHVLEEWKWRGVPVWSHDGILCTGESYQQVIKLTFARGASLLDPHHLFNSSLEGNTRRAINLREGDKIDEAAFSQLILAAIAANSTAHANKKKVRTTKPKPVRL